MSLCYSAQGLESSGCFDLAVSFSFLGEVSGKDLVVVEFRGKLLALFKQISQVKFLRLVLLWHIHESFILVDKLLYIITYI